MKKLFAFCLVCFLSATSFAADGASTNYIPYDWSFKGMFGLFDRAQLRRGYQVYKEVCASCHSMRYLHFRNLGEAGGLGYTAPQVKALAGEYKVQDGPNADGDMFERTARPADAFPSPFENDIIARASNGGALPPDLSLIAKARFGGADYIHSLLQGYGAPPIGLEVPPGQYYNRYFNPLIAMAPPLSDEQVEYEDGTKATVGQMSADVSAFLAWAAEPHREARKRIGFQVLIYLSILAVLLFLTQKSIWKKAH